MSFSARAGRQRMGRDLGLAVTVALLASGTLPDAIAAEAMDESFMPKGGRTLLLEFTGGGADLPQLRLIAQGQHDEAQWRALVDAGKAAPANERARATLAAYLTVNMPLPAAVAERSDLAAHLPPDGRELAWNECQSCHSLFMGYLTQSRDEQGWRSIFLSPFHKELKLGPNEREEFARYAARNMPMKAEDVPPDLRF